MKLLLISNSTNAGEEYLRYPMPEIGRFLEGAREIAFVPYAAVTFSYADYEKKVQARFSELGIRVRPGVVELSSGMWVKLGGSVNKLTGVYPAGPRDILSENGILSEYQPLLDGNTGGYFNTLVQIEKM